MKRLFICLLCCNVLAAQTAGPGISTVYYASKSGAILDCNLSTGLQIGTGGTCTNNDAVLNGILALATATNPVTLIVDGPTITTGVVGPAAGYWKLDCLNLANGLYMAPGSNAHIIRNIALPNWYYTVGNGSTPGARGHDITIQNCFLNGNRGDGTTGNSNSGNPRQAANGYWLFGIYLDNMQQVKIDNVSLYNSPSFQLHLNACVDCEIRGVRIDNNVPTALNMDGIHIDGPSSYIRIIDPWFNTNDDAIALNAAEGYSGAIHDVSVVGSHCYACLSAMRVLADEDGGGTNDQVYNVNFSNGSGVIADSQHGSNVFEIGYAHSNTSNLDIMGPIKISNSTYITNSADTQMAYVSDNVSELSFNNVTWIAPQGATSWLNFGQVSTISSFNCTACRIYRNTGGHAAAWFATIPGGSTVQRMELNGFSVENEAGQSYSAIPYAIDVQSGGAIGSLILTAVEPNLITSLLNGNEWSRITNFYGSGVSNFFRNTTYSKLPPASYCGLEASISDSNAGGVWGAAEAGGSAGHPAKLWANCTNWTVTGK